MFIAAASKTNGLRVERPCVPLLTELRANGLVLWTSHASRREISRVGFHLMRRPAADSSINLSSRLSLVSSCLALTIHQFMVLR